MASEHVTDAEFGLAVKAMADAGAAHGKAAGSWIADGNTREDALRNLLQLWEDGDPAAPYAPDPLSGEWADSPTLSELIDECTELDADTLDDGERDSLATAYEEAFRDAWQEEAERTVRGFLNDE